MTRCYLCPGQVITENGHSACEGCGTSYELPAVPTKPDAAQLTGGALSSPSCRSFSSHPCASRSRTDVAPGPGFTPRQAGRARHLFTTADITDWLGGIALFVAIGGGMFLAWAVQ